MKKIFTFIAAALMTVGANAQTPQILTEVEPGTFAITTSYEELQASFSAESALWGDFKYGIALPAGYVLFENANVEIKTAVETPIVVKDGNGKVSDMQKEFPDYTAAINLGSSLGNNHWGGDEQIFADALPSRGNQGIVSVTPKTDGVLKFGVFIGDNSRAIGIYKLATTDEQIDNEDFGWVATNDFRHGDPAEDVYYDNATYDPATESWVYEANPNGVQGAPAYVEAAVEAGREYLLIGGGGSNMALHQISFVTGETGISSAIIENAAKSNVMYNLAGQRITAPVSGQIYILNGKKYIAK